MPSPHVADLHDSDGPTLLTYLEWLRRRWWVLAAAALLGVGAGLLITLVQTKTYTSTTSVLVRQLPPESGMSAKVNLDTEAQLVRSLVVAEQAKKLMQTGLTEEELVKSVTVTVPPNSQVLQIAYAAHTPTQAQTGSHAFAQAYLDLRLASATRAMEGETNALRQQIDEVNKQLATVAARIAKAPANSVERARAEADRNVLTNRLTTLTNRLSPLLSTSLDSGEIISDASLPKDPSSPNRTLNLASGLGAGLLLGIVLALVLDRLDTRVRRGRDITGRTGLPALLDIPVQSAPLAILPPAHRVSRELGRLRNVLLSAVPEPRIRGNGQQLLLASTSAGSAAGFVAGNLAAAYARTGQQVVVLSTRADSPLTGMLTTPPRYTLADVLRRDITVLNALAPVPGLSQLRVLLPGKLDTEAELPVATMLDLLGKLAARFDYVLIETAQPTLAVEAQALARHVDAVLLIAERGETRHSEINAALRQFEQVDAAVIGAVLAPRLPVVPTVGGRGATRPGRPGNAKAGDGHTDSESTARRGRRPSPGPRVDPVGTPADGQPPTVDSTIILPRVTEMDSRPGPAKSSPGQPGVYRSQRVEVNGNDTTTRISTPLNGEGRE